MFRHFSILISGGLGVEGCGTVCVIENKTRHKFIKQFREIGNFPTSGLSSEYGWNVGWW